MKNDQKYVSRSGKVTFRALLVTHKITRYSQQNSLITRGRSSSLQQIARCLLQK